MVRTRIAAAAAAAAAALSLGAVEARAQDVCPQQDAASAKYQEGARALEEERFADAARRFAAADALCTHDVALGEALQTVAKADDPLLCMNLVERAERRHVLSELSGTLRAQCSQQAGRLLIRCPGSTCRAQVDGEPAPLHQHIWARIGEHVVQLSVGNTPAQTHRVTVVAGQDIVVPSEQSAPPSPQPSPVVPAPKPPPVATTSDGLSPAYFFVALGLTAVSGAVLIWSGVDTLGQNDDFKSTPSTASQQGGRDAQLRTNAFIGVTAALAVASGVLALFTSWGGSEQPEGATMLIVPSTRGAMLGVQMVF